MLKITQTEVQGSMEWMRNEFENGRNRRISWRVYMARYGGWKEEDARLHFRTWRKS